MSFEYKDAHDKLLSGIGTPEKYHRDWRKIADGMRGLVTPNGFDPQHSDVSDAIREKLASAVCESAALRLGADSSITAVGAEAIDCAKRILALKTVRHLYLQPSFGRQKVWILSLPEQLKAFPMDFAGSSSGLVDTVLNSTGERFSDLARKDLGDASQLGLMWVHKAMIVAGSPLKQDHRKLFHRWFVPSGTANETAKINAWASMLMTHLQKIASGLKAGEVILTDSPQERRTNSRAEKSEAFVFDQDDLVVVYVEKGFFSAKNTLTGITNWARILVHELSHLYAKTKDHAYSWQGLLPRDDDAFKRVNDIYIRHDEKFPAVRALTLEQCRENADSWAFFCADAGGALSDSDRMRALGTRLYDIGKQELDESVATRLRNRAA